jgi:outer membrane protein TolC
LRQVLALEPEEPLDLAAAARELPDAPAFAPLATAAIERRPELDDLAYQVLAYEKQRRVVGAESLPQLELNGFWGREVRELDNFSDPLYDAWAVSVDLRWELFDGGRRRAQTAQIESQRQQVALQRADLEARVRLETGQARSDYQTARARAAATVVAADAAGEAVRVARESYEQGVATQTDLLDAQSRATAAAVSAVEAFYDARVEAARLARAVGVLPTASWTELAENP